MPHPTTKRAWIRPHHAPPPPPKPIDPIASNMGLLQFFAGTRQRSTSPTKPPPKRGAAAAQGKGPAGKESVAKVKLPKGLGLEGLEGLQYRPPPPPPPSQPPTPPPELLRRRREVVEVFDHSGAAALTDGEAAEARREEEEEEEEEEGGEEEVVVVQRRERPRRTTTGSVARYREDAYHAGGRSVRDRAEATHESDYRLRPPPPPPPQRSPLLRGEPKSAAVAAVVGSGYRVRSDLGPLPHVGGAMVRRGVGDEVGRGREAREALERGIRERRLERFGREERGWRGGGEGGYEGRMVGRDVGRLGSGSRAMREAITPLVM